MAATIRIKRRAAGGAAGAPATLAAAELAFNEQDNTLYYGKGDSGAGIATSIIAIGGSGSFVNSSLANTWTGAQTFNGNTVFGGSIDFGSGAITNLPLSKLSDTTITGVTNGQTITWNGTAWVNTTPTASAVYSVTDAEVTAAAGADTSSKITAALITKGAGGGGITSAADLHAGDISVVGGNVVGVSGSWIFSGTGWIVMPSGGGSGTVTSVAMTVPPWLSVAGSPVTTSGTFAITSAAQPANALLAGPTTGADAVPAFRALVAGDIPDLSTVYATAARTVTSQDGVTVGNAVNPTGTSANLGSNLFVGIGTIDCGTF